MKLYQYMPWRPFDEKGNIIENYHVRDNLINSQLYLSSAKDFNDPFDLSPCVKINSSEEEWLLNFTQLLMSNNNLLSYDQAKLEAEKMITVNNLKTPDGRNAKIKQLYDKLYTIGVCCFTLNDPEKILMWSHYGDMHRGICLCFEFPDDLLPNLHYHFKPFVKITSPRQVIYNTDLPIIDPFVFGYEELTTILKTKSKEWCYEQEYRMICYNYLGVIQYNPIFLKKVIAGCKMIDKELSELKEVFNNAPQLPKLQVARKKSQEFALEFFNA